MEAERALNVNQAAERLGVDPESVRRLIRLGKLPAAKIGHNWRLRPSDLDALFEARKRGAPNDAPEPQSQPPADETPVQDRTPAATEDAEDLVETAAAIAEAEREGTISLEEFKAELGLNKPAVMTAYDQAVARIDAVPELAPYREIILRPHAEGDAHYRWVLSAHPAEIAAWAQAVASDAEEEGEP